MEHDILFLHCSHCGIDKMKIQLSKNHGMIILCADCQSIILILENGDHFDVQMSQVLKKGCEIDQAHKEERIN